MTETRTTSSSGGQKGVKPERHSLVPRDPMKWVARVYGFGASKYADHNWRKGYEFSKSIDSLQRHVDEFVLGNELDDESGLPHLAHAAFHLLSLLEWTQGPDKADYVQHDDRYRRPEPESMRIADQFSFDEVTTLDGQDNFFEVIDNAMRTKYDQTVLEDLRKTLDTMSRVEVKDLRIPTVVPSLPKVDVSAFQKFVDEDLRRLAELMETPRTFQRVFAAGVDKAMSSSWGVGDKVMLRLSEPECRPVAFTLTRKYGGAWLLNDTQTAVWTDETVSEAILTGVVGDFPYVYAVENIVRQRRPWREGSPDAWKVGDEVSYDVADLHLKWTRDENGSWRSSTGVPRSDESINLRVRGLLRMGRNVTFHLVDYTHEAGEVRRLGG